MKQRLIIIFGLFFVIHQNAVFSRDIKGDRSVFHKNIDNNLLNEFNNEIGVSVIDLSGTWNFTPVGLSQMTIEVPSFYVWKVDIDNGPTFDTSVQGPWKIVEGYPEAKYEKEIVIPSSMAGKHLFLCFERVNYVTDIFINNQYVGSHLGGNVPFELDITNFVNVPSTDTIRVEIKYWDSRFINAQQFPVWPVGYYGNYWNLGITGDVSLVARSAVYIEDVFITTSVRNHTITAEITVINFDTIDHTVDLTADITDGGSPVFSLPAQQLTVLAGDTEKVTIVQEWQNPELWSPQNPHLYDCICQLYENSSFVHGISMPFGFREFWIENDHFVLNGITFNLRGDNLVIQSENEFWTLFLNSPELWSSSIDSMLSLNFNHIRLHERPPQDWIVEECDRKGMLVIAESGIYFRNVVPYQSAKYTANGVIWQKEWVRANRKHTSIVIWSAENEMYYWGNKLCTIAQLLQFGSAIEELDTSRPISYDGDQDLSGNTDVFSYHYIYGFPTGWPTDIYDIGTRVKSDKPTAHGEFDWTRGSYPESNRVMRQMIKIRAMRIVGFDDIRPYRLDWAWHPDPGYCSYHYYGWNPTEANIQFLKNSMNPIAVFDRNYYRYSINPALPAYDEGDPVVRTLEIFNDDLQDNIVKCYWNVLLNDEIVYSGDFNLFIPLGTHIQKTIQFPAPCVTANQSFKLELRTFKNDEQRYLEEYVFRTRDIGISPPNPVASLEANRNGNSVLLNWTPVTQNTESNPTTINHYEIHRSTDFHFSAVLTDTFNTGSGITYTDSNILGDPDNNYFYRICAVDNHQIPSEPSGQVSEFEFNLQTTSGTDFNEIAIPLIAPDITNAQELMGAISGCNSIARWNASLQGYEQYIPGISATNFNVETGYPYYVNATENTVFSLVGEIAYPTFNLITTSGTDFNEIMIPLNKTEILKASDLMADISSCNSVAKWNTALQGYEQYIPGLSSTDFNVSPGYPYYVNVTANVSWPVTSPAKSYSDSENDIAEINIRGSEAPHAIWGMYDYSDHSSHANRVHFVAYIVSRPFERLTDISPGCQLKNSVWIVQCGNFLSKWKAGERLKIIFKDENNLYYGEKEVSLSYNPDDKADPVYLTRTELMPDRYKLYQNVPNPFNGQTIIKYQISEPTFVSIKVFNCMGQEVIILVNRDMYTGFYEVKWNGMDRDHHLMPSGIYIIEMKAGDYIETRKMVFVQ